MYRNGVDFVKAIGIGTDDFKEIRENDYLFIDKTLLIKELIDDGSKALLFPDLEDLVKV